MWIRYNLNVRKKWLTSLILSFNICKGTSEFRSTLEKCFISTIKLVKGYRNMPSIKILTLMMDYEGKRPYKTDD